MATEILAIGTSDANSSDVVVSSTLTVGLKTSAGPQVDGSANVLLQLKDDGGQYFTVDVLNQAKPAVLIAAAGTYRFRRLSSSSCGVFSA